MRTRREFITASASFGAAIGVGALCSGAAWADPMGLLIGIQLYTVRDVMRADTPGTLKQLHDIGYREVETTGFGKYSAKEFGQLIRSAGLSCPSAHLQMNALDLVPIFDNAHALGVRYAVSSFLPIGRP